MRPSHALHIGCLLFLLVPLSLQAGDPDAELLLDHGRQLARQGKVQEALPFFEQGVDMAEASLSSPTPQLAAHLRELAALYADAGRPERAETELRRAVTMLRQVLGAQDPRLLPATGDLARLLTARGKLAQAEALHRERLELLTSPAAADFNEASRDAELIATLTQLGVLADLQRRVEEAASRYRQVIETADGRDHESLEVAAALSNLATIVIAQEALVPAEPLLRRAIDLRSRLLGPRHWLPAADRASLARLLFKLGNLDESRRWADRAADVLSPYCSGLNAEDPWSSRDAHRACLGLTELRSRLSAPAETSSTLDEPAPRPVAAQQPAADSPPDRWFRAQVASRQQRPQAQRELEDIQRRFPRLLGGIPSRLEAVDLPEKGVWYRLQLGAFETHAEARDFCRRLRRAGLPDCWVAVPPAPPTRE